MEQESIRLGPPKFLVASAAGRLIPVLLLACLSGWASPEASISGKVVDPSEAVIPGVTVVIRNVETGVRQMTTTNSDGFYSLPALPPGHYQIEVHHSGFRPVLRSGLILETGNAMEIDLKLDLGEQTTSVTVTELGIHVDTADTTMGETITTSKMASVPLNGRSFTDLLALQPGVVPVSSQQPNAVVMSGCTSTPPSGDLNAGNLSVNGQRETSNGFIVNGSTVEEDFSMGTALIPNLDSLQEFRVLTSNFDAEYGNYSGGQIVVTTKSGTNELHGSGFDFLRNTNLDARNYFSSDRARYDQSQFGGTFGGPIKKEKSFFFIDYQGTRMTEGVETGLISVPAIPERTGDLSGIASSLTGAVNGQSWANLLSQRLGYPVYPGEAYYTPGCASSAQCVLPNAQIPLSAWSGPAKSLLLSIPLPNQGANTFSTSAYDETLRDDKGAVRIDNNTGLGALAAYYFFDDYALNNPYPMAQGGANVPGFNAITLGRAQMMSLGLTKVLGPTMVNEFHLGYLRDANNVGQPQGGVGPSLASQGFVDGAGNPSIYALSPKIEGIENVSFNDFTLGVDTTGLKEANNTFQVSENFSKVMGTHVFKVGAGFHIDQVNINPDATFNGAFSFTGAETGSDFADFLLGVPSSYAQGDSLAFYLRDKYVGIYAQDSWRVAEPVNPVDPNLSKAVSAFDMRHNFVTSYKYELPIDYLVHRRNRLTEGWSLTGITRFSTGFPVTLYNNNDTSLLGTIPNGINNNGVDTPNVAPGNLEVNTDPRNGRPAFNTSLFSLPALGQMGTAARRFFYGPGIANSDLALLKSLHLTESKSLQFRVEAFNFANHAQFYGAAAVSGNISSLSFGRVVSAADPRLLQIAVKFYF